MTAQRWWLAAGDLLALILVTLIGFAVHGETDLSFLPRWLAVVFPLSACWLISAAATRLLQPEALVDRRRIWRVPVTACLACIPAAWLRSLILSVPVSPAFLLVLAATSALGITAWRVIYMIAYERRARAKQIP